ncbi:MAG: hypothetical protein JWO70_362 [Betaproteobacteria bacterium]|nr:hypothetical protein [Betaproteobacteria bacterium]
MNRSLLIAAMVAVGLTACSKKEDKVVTPPPATAPAAPSTTAPTPTPAPGADSTAPGTGSTSSSSSTSTAPMGTTPASPASPNESKPDEKK